MSATPNTLFLWVKKASIYLLIALIIAGLVVYYLANSAWTVGKLADTFAPDYNITYGRIHGNVFTGLQLEDLAYNDVSLAKHITLKWNPNSIVNQTISVNTLRIEEANLEGIKKLVDAFSSTPNQEDNASTDTQTSAALMPKWVVVDAIDITVLGFSYEPVLVNHLAFQVKKLVFDIEQSTLEHATLDIQSSTNLSDLDYTSTIKHNTSVGNITLNPTEELFTLYALPLCKDAIGKINIELNASKQQVTANLSKTIKQLLKTKDNNETFNVDIDTLVSSLVYDIPTGTLQVQTDAMLSTPYAKDIMVNNTFRMAESMHYSGKVYAKQLLGVDAKFVKPLNGLELEYSGNASSIDTLIKADNLKGSFVSKDFKTAALHLETPKPIVLNELLQLPAELNQTKATLQVDIPLHFESNASLGAQAKIKSNVINVDANISYAEQLGIQARIDIPKTSLLRPYDEAVKWDALTPIALTTTLAKEEVQTRLSAGPLKLDARYGLEDTGLDGTVALSGLEATIAGKTKETLTIQTNLHSIPSVMKSIETVYTLKDVPVIEGGGDVGLEIKGLKTANLTLKSSQIRYWPDTKTVHQLDNISLVLSAEDTKVQVKNYAFTYDKQTFFSTKPSIIDMKEDVVTIAPLWLNDMLEVQGEYQLKTKKGTLRAVAPKLHIDHEAAVLDSGVDIKTVLDGNKTAITGNINILGGNILYDLGQKTYASDSDIRIVQEMKNEAPSVFMDNLSVGVQIKTQTPFVYNKDAINIQSHIDLGVHKAEHANLMVLGSIALLEGGTYKFENKTFVLGKSYVYFTGNPNKPLLEITAKYKSLNHLITITITGSADAPNIDFASVPRLSKEEILSVILFDSEGGAGTNSSEDMMKMMGGAMAKSALSDLGVKLDHLVLGASGSVEVGKKLTDDITVIYINGELPLVKVKYKHTDNTESVVGASEESQSYDIIYKKDF